MEASLRWQIEGAVNVFFTAPFLTVTFKMSNNRVK
jgi:hypothetical protein